MNTKEMKTQIQLKYLYNESKQKKMKRNELKGIMKTIQNMIELRITKEHIEIEK